LSLKPNAWGVFVVADCGGDTRGKMFIATLITALCVSRSRFKAMGYWKFCEAGAAFESFFGLRVLVIDFGASPD